MLSRVTHSAAARNGVVLATTIPVSAHSFYPPALRELRVRGIHTTVVVSGGPELASLRMLADEVVVIPMAREIKPIADARALVSWVRVLRRTRPCAVLAGTPKAALLAMMAARATGVPTRIDFLMGLRLETVTGAHRRVLAAAERLTSAASTLVVAVSPSLARVFVEAGLDSGRRVMIPHHGSTHGVDARKFAPRARDASLARRLGLDDGVFTVICVGRITADKGFDTVAGALRRMGASGIAVQLLVVGDANESDSSQILESLRAAHVHSIVVERTNQVPAHLALADVLVLQTRREGLPNVVLEASAMELPVVTTTATGAVDSVVDGETGLLVPVADAVALAEALLKLARDPELRRAMGAAGRARVLRDFAPEDVARALVDFIVSPALPCELNSGGHRG